MRGGWGGHRRRKGAARAGIVVVVVVGVGREKGEGIQTFSILTALALSPTLHLIQYSGPK